MKKSSNTNGSDTYVVSFMTDDVPKNEEEERRMTVNNNFNSEQLGSKQIYLESGNPMQSGPQPNNIQLLSPSSRGSMY